MAQRETRLREQRRIVGSRFGDCSAAASDTRAAPRQLDVAGLVERCCVLEAELSLLGGVADALARRADPELALHNLLAAMLDAASISKGALILRRESGLLELRAHIGFSAGERLQLDDLLARLPFLEELIDSGGGAVLPSIWGPGAAGPGAAGATGVVLYLVPLMSEGQGIGAMIVGSTPESVTSEAAVAFVRAIGNQIVQSLALTRSVASLKTSEQRYRTLLEGASDAIAVLTLGGIVREVNHRWEALTGLSRDQLIGRHARELAPSHKDSRTTHTFEAAVNAACDKAVPIEIAGRGGVRVLIEVSSTIVEVGGEPLVLTISRDVTEQRRLEDQLHQSRKLEGIGQLAGGVAHDFNNLLTIILGLTEIAMSELHPDDPVRAGLEEISQAGARAAALTRQLLAFSRKQVLEPRLLDMTTVVSDMGPLLRRLILENVELTFVLPSDIHLVYMDPSQLERILVNLVVNAADAMPRGGTLTIETSNVAIGEGDLRGQLPAKAGAFVMLTVTDTGVGMDEATSRRIFEPFFTTKGPDKGTGLGLATVYGIVKQSGGDICLYSEPGMGTTFKIYLPRAIAGKHAPSPAASEAMDLSRGVESILLVEDDKDVRRLARIRLERNGYRVFEAGNPREAAALALKIDEEIHLLLSDVVMPESDGEPLFDQLRATRPGLRVLYMSGYADEAVVRRGMIPEGMPFLQKPFTPGTLAKKVREILDAERRY
jgi:two-component system, cell cycle sensor histidine kinase and response regulator CckA